MPLIRKDAPAGAPVPSPDPIAQLKSLNPDDRWSAARAFPKEPENVEALGVALAAETDSRVREALLTSLTLIKTDSAVAAILPLLRSEDAAVRTGALDALGAMTDMVEPYIQGLLADPDPDIRLLVCDTVRRLPSLVASRYLCALLDRESQPNVCAAAIDALSEVGDKDVLPSLARCAERFAQEPFLHFSIKVAAERVGGDGRERDPQPA
jgi:HEAT repeat protein